MTRRPQAEGQTSFFDDGRPKTARPVTPPAEPAALPRKQWARHRASYDKRPGTHLPKESRNNVWMEIGGKYIPRASFDRSSGVYQRSTYSTYIYLESLTFYPVEINSIKNLPIKFIEHVDLDHFDGEGKPLYDHMRCYRIPFSRFRTIGHWGDTTRGQRWIIPLWAWDIVGLHGTVIRAGADTKPEPEEEP